MFRDKRWVIIPCLFLIGFLLFFNIFGKSQISTSTISESLLLRINQTHLDDNDEPKLGNKQASIPRTNNIYRKDEHEITHILKEHIAMTDYMNIPRLPFLSNFKNPCFKVYDDKNRAQLRCLPYFMIGGFPKTGTTDLYHRLNRHPLIAGPAKGK